MIRESPLQRVAAALTQWSTRWVPDAFVIALILTALVGLLALGWTPASPAQLLDAWGAGVWSLLEFASQMCLVLLGGYVLALAPPTRRVLDALAQLPKTPRGAVAATALVSMGLALVHWGLSIVASAFFVRAIGRRRIGADHRLLCAAGYLGLGCLWHAGLSASAPLLLATKGKYSEYFGVIPITETLLLPINVGLVVVCLIVLTAVAAAMHPAPSQAICAPPDALLEDPPTPQPAPSSPAAWLEDNRALAIIPGVLALGFVVARVWNLGPAALNINTVNLGMLALGMILHTTPRRFLAAASQSADGLWPIVLQFPFYAGILGIIDGSGLNEVLAGAFSSVSSPQAFPLFVTWYSGLLNYVVPSGGSKLAIEASYIAKASANLGVPMNITVMAYAWGDMLTDIIQPFWAIPLLGAARLGFKDIMGYCLVLFVVYALLVTAGFGLYWAGILAF